MRRVLLDQGLPPRAAAFLRDEGWDVIHVREIGMNEAEDEPILTATSLRSSRFQGRQLPRLS